MAEVSPGMSSIDTLRSCQGNSSIEGSFSSCARMSIDSFRLFRLLSWFMTRIETFAFAGQESWRLTGEPAIKPLRIGTELDIELDPGFDPEIDPELDPELGLELGPELGPELDPELDPGLCAELDLELCAELDFEFDPGLGPELDPELGPELDPGLGPGNEMPVENSSSHHWYEATKLVS